MVEPVANCPVFGKTATTALRISKAAHEFLVFHYFATDSIVYWNSFLHEVLPLLPLPVPAVRRAEVVDMMMVLVHNCIGLGLFPAEDVVRAGDCSFW